MTHGRVEDVGFCADEIDDYPAESADTEKQLEFVHTGLHS